MLGQDGFDIVQAFLDQNYSQPFTLYYTEGTEDPVVLYSNYEFKVHRNTRYTLSFSLSDTISNGTISATTVDEGDMNEVPI